MQKLNALHRQILATYKPYKGTILHGSLLKLAQGHQDVPSLYHCHTKQQHFLYTKLLLPDHLPIVIGETFHHKMTVHFHQVGYSCSEYLWTVPTYAVYSISMMSYISSTLSPFLSITPNGTYIR